MDMAFQNPVKGTASADVDSSAEVFPCLMDVGEAMLKCGADVHTVEQTLVATGKAYGAKRMNVLVITAVIIMTVTFPDNREHTFSRRVIGEGGSNFTKLEALSVLCDECIASPMPVEELKARLSDIKRLAMSDLNLFLGGALSSGGFAIFFGGTILDGLVSAAFAMLVCLSIKYFRPFTPNTIVFNFVTSLICGIAICFVAGFMQMINVNTVIIGVIMLLIPGVAMTNATRDMLSGDTISGVMRFIESLLWATSLAIGFMAALWIGGLAGWNDAFATTSVEWPIWAMIIFTAISSLGFTLFFNVSRRHILSSTIGGVVTWLIFNAFTSFVGGVFLPALVASTFAAIYAEALARRNKIPNAIFFIIAVIPLVPGRGLYYTMFNAVMADWGQCLSYAISTLLYAAGIAVGICLIAAFVQIWDIWRRKHGRT